MGMDLCGIENDDAYFRSNGFEWRQLLGLCVLAGYIPPDRWDYNFELGFKTQEECDVLSDILESYLMDHCESSMPTANIPELDWCFENLLPGSIWIEGLMAEDKSKYSITRGYALEFVDFLRKCGGFVID